jgi:hypothetical protein
MKTLRTLHLYLGCVFAPLIIFFAISGLWQTFGWTWNNHWMAQLSSIHTGHGTKMGPNLSSPYMHWLVVAMALALVFTIVLGVFMAFRLGHKRTAIWCLFGGIVAPVTLALLALCR